ncbi:MAG: hypothetical protein LC804_24205 [Acidobacteria bacterium]|nr:hypothetical protein [Acidobacteriota bacterium]
MIWVLPALLTVALAGVRPSPAPAVGGVMAAAAALLDTPDRRVRTSHPRLADLLARGVRRSRTFAELVLALNGTDVIVYIETSSNLPSHVAGRLLLLPLANDQRYLRIQVRQESTPADLIALMGHELRHALEVAAVPGVRSQEALVELYQRIGTSARGAHSYDTVAAQNTGRRVRSELTS